MILQKLGAISPINISAHLNVIDSAASQQRKQRFQTASEKHSLINCDSECGDSLKLHNYPKQRDRGVNPAHCR